MIVIRFPDTDTKRRALGFLAGRFSFKSWTTGEVAVPEGALAHLATEGISFAVEGPVNVPEGRETEQKAPSASDASEPPSLDDVYAILNKRFDSGEHDVAARHNEHQP